MSSDSLKLTPEEVVQRLERLESETRIWRWVCTSLLIAAAVVVLEGSALVKPKSRVEAQEIALRDTNGRVRAYFALNDQGKPELVFHDDQGRECWKLYTDTDNSASMAFFDQGHLRMLLNAPTDGSANLLMVDNDQRNMAHYYLHDGHHVGVSMSNIHDGLHLRLKDDRTSPTSAPDLPVGVVGHASRSESPLAPPQHSPAIGSPTASVTAQKSPGLVGNQAIAPAVNRSELGSMTRDSATTTSGVQAAARVTTQPISRPRLIPMPGLEEMEAPRSVIDFLLPESDTH